MKRSIWLLASLLFVVPAFAQDEGGGGGLPSSLFGGGDVGGRGGNQANPMDAVKKFFVTAGVTFASDQEKILKPIVETAFKQVQDTVERLTPQLAGGDRGGRGGQGGGGRGGGGAAGGNADGGQRRGRGGAGGGVNVESNPLLAAELQKINDEVLVKVLAVLKPEQQAAFKKWQNGEIKKGGGFAALKVIMDEAGAPLTAEQVPQIQGFYTEASQQRTQLQREGRGQADPAKLRDLDAATMTKVAKVLNAAQRKALLDSRPK